MCISTCINSASLKCPRSRNQSALPGTGLTGFASCGHCWYTGGMWCLMAACGALGRSCPCMTAINNPMNIATSTAMPTYACVRSALIIDFIGPSLHEGVELRRTDVRWADLVQNHEGADNANSSPESVFQRRKIMTELNSSVCRD